jgi:hypothetical protein
VAEPGAVEDRGWLRAVVLDDRKWVLRVFEVIGRQRDRGLKFREDRNPRSLAPAVRLAPVLDGQREEGTEQQESRRADERQIESPFSLADSVDEQSEWYEGQAVPPVVAFRQSLQRADSVRRGHWLGGKHSAQRREARC